MSVSAGGRWRRRGTRPRRRNNKNDDDDDAAALFRLSLLPISALSASSPPPSSQQGSPPYLLAGSVPCLSIRGVDGPGASSHHPCWFSTPHAKASIPLTGLDACNLCVLGG